MSLIRAEEKNGDKGNCSSNNPFRLPSDEQVFSLREKERKAKAEWRARLQEMNILEKTAEQSKRKGITWRSLDKPDGHSLVAIDDKKKKSGGVLSSAVSTAISSDRRREKENMTDFIAKKREMFLVQMSLDTKREEIRKLEEKAQLKEEALRKSELMLEEDAIRFDTFLKENDKKAHEAIKRAEMETKLKHEKVQQIKKLNHQIQGVQSDTSKLREQLEDCLRYKTFLDELTPPEWFVEQAKAQRLHIRRAWRALVAKRLREYELARVTAIEEHEELQRKEDARVTGSSASGGRRNRKDLVNSLPPPKIPEYPKFDFSNDGGENEGENYDKEDAPEADDDTGAAANMGKAASSESKKSDTVSTNATSKLIARAEEDALRDPTLEEDELAEAYELWASGKDEFKDVLTLDQPMYFQDPMQLLNVFTQLEESNLFLIQNSQETEQALEELKQEFRETTQKMDVKTDSLKGNIFELHSQIEQEEDKAKLLRVRMGHNMGEDAQEEMLRELNEKVKEVYKKCGFYCDASPSTLSMLTDLEARLEDLLEQIEQIPEEYVVKAEKMKEKERRERVRTERMAQQQQIYEERLRKSIERSMQAPKKKTGKPVMFRSAPPQKKERKKDDSAAEEKAQDMKEFFNW